MIASLFVVLAPTLCSALISPVPPCSVKRRRTALPRRPAARESEAEEGLELAVVATASAAAFATGLWFFDSHTAALEFTAGYLIEQSLSVDNLLVFLVLFEFFKIPAGPMQQKALAYGLYGAVVCRAVFVAAGAFAIQQYRPVLLVFAAILIFASAKLLTDSGEEDDAGDDLSENAVVKLTRRVIPASDSFDAEDPTRFFTRDGLATPLLLAVVCLELSDIVFAVDSVPAVFAVSTDPLIVYSSNIFAIVGLRAWFRLLATAADRFQYLDKAVAVVLGLVGFKIAASFFDIDIDTGLSLAVVAGVLSTGIIASIVADADDVEGNNKS